ncbi:hypothetical protein HG535_0D02140 [Zygotorulaspora mrakii]|uniref:glucan 1,4-alpha-glucosidase n=1 Tax=Zygotorulaspora mrakii TaxID=42260 RepID=A0A7H9B246_ZYGMR|nr:uncharacterized protein HG535_0D02140 [Zygotorulaspora mrakii]QLG72506.1 hypothetical protein HG535_0D02140 [Zygotorulaspora mrakii]
MGFEKAKGCNKFRNFTVVLTVVFLALVTLLKSKDHYSVTGDPLVGHSHRNDVDGANRSGNNITIVDFFKPYDPAYPTSAPTSRFFKKINLRPLSPYSIPRVNFTVWIDEQYDISFERLLLNIGDQNLANYDSLRGNNVLEGVIIASPSQNEPNYFFQWIRDSAIAMNTIVFNLFSLDAESAESAGLNVTLAGTVLKYLKNSYELQRLENPSGSGVDSDLLKGLGEPKWNVDNRPFLDAWGRPQNDGPSLRTLTSFHFLRELQKNSVSLEDVIAQYESHFQHELDLPFENERELYENIIFWDLQFVVKNWKDNTFDLWEEIQGQHFFTSIVQISSIKVAIAFLKDHEKDWSDLQEFVNDLETCYDELTSFIFEESGFLNPNKNFIVETPSMLHSRSGLDIAVIIGSILTHNYELSNSSNSIPFDVDDSGVLNTLYSMVRSMEIIYPINHQRAKLKTGVALGRYPEDIYDGVKTSEGNPWFLSTAYASELLYRLILRNYQFGDDLIISLDNWESEFWTLIFEGFDDYVAEDNLNYNGNSNGNKNTYQLVIPFNSPAFNQTMLSIFDLAESFLDKIREHVSDDGNMSEQFNKYTGYLQGAENLSWSYGAFWTSCNVRSKVLELLQ